MNVIFLDIEGVLNSESFFLMRYRNMEGLKLIDIKNIEPSLLHIYDINPYNLDILKELISLTDSKIVITSSWKKLKDFDKYLKKLTDLGLPIIDVTHDQGFNRGHGIKEYIKENNVINYIIIDDEIFSDYDEEIMNRLVKTNFNENGFDEKCKVKAVKLLNN